MGKGFTLFNLEGIRTLGAPFKAQRSGFGWERRSSEVSELLAEPEARDTEHATTTGL